MMLVRSGYATFRRNWIVTLRAYPWSFFIGSLMTGGLAVLLSYFLFHLLANGQLNAQFVSYAGTADYMSYVISGAAMFTLATRVMLGVSRSMITERREGTLASLLLTPVPRYGYFTGVTIQWVVASLIEVAVMLLIVWPLGLNFSHAQPITLLIVLPVAVVGLLGMSLVLGALMLATGDTYLSQNTLFMLMMLVSGFTFPPKYLPLPLQWVGEALPVTGILRLLRDALLFHASPLMVAGDIVISSLLSLLYVVAGFALMRWAERRATEGANA